MQILTALWPFIKEVFLKNDEFKKDISKPTFVLRAIAMVIIAIALVMGGHQIFSQLFVESFNRSRLLSDEVTKLDKEFHRVSDEKIKLRMKCEEMLSELEDTKRELEKLSFENSIMKEGVTSLRMELSEKTEECPDKELVEKESVSPKPKIQYKKRIEPSVTGGESSVINLLEELK